LTWLITEEDFIAYHHHEHFSSYINAVRDISVTEPQVNKGAIGNAFKKDAKRIMEHLAVLDEDDLTEMEKSLEDNG
jgi:hypothetical protein